MISQKIVQQELGRRGGVRFGQAEYEMKEAILDFILLLQDIVYKTKEGREMIKAFKVIEKENPELSKRISTAFRDTWDLRNKMIVPLQKLVSGADSKYFK